MKLVDEKILNKISAQEGFKDSDELVIETRIKKAEAHIDEYIDEKDLILEAEECLDKTREFCEKLTELFKQEFIELLKNYIKEKRTISKPILDYLKEKKFDLPKFTITHGTEAQNLLEKYGFRLHSYKNKVILVFQLPKPLANFWWKGGIESWGTKAVDIQGSAIEWGHFYREIMDVVWGAVGFYECEKGLNFDRINSGGEHDPKNYYYIWEMSQWKSR